MADPSISISPALASVIWDSPVIQPPSGVPVNTVDPPGLWNTTLAVTTIQVIIAAIALVTRLLSTFLVRKKLLLEDFFAYIGFAFYIGLLIPGQIGAQGKYAFGTDIWNMTYGSLSHLLYIANICEFNYGMGVLFIKLAILFHMKRIFAPTRSGNEAMWFASWALIILHVLFYVIHGVLVLAGCIPRSKIWNPILPGTCINIQVLEFASAIVNVPSDFAILLIPIVRVWKLQMSTVHKANLSLIFAVGLLGCVSSIMRAYYSWAFVQSSNITLTIYWIGLWGELELMSGLFASAVPFMPKCYREIKRRTGARSQSRGYHSHPSATLPSKTSRSESADSKFNYHGATYVASVTAEAGGRIQPGHSLSPQYSVPLRSIEKTKRSGSGGVFKSLPPSPPSGYSATPAAPPPAVELDARMQEIYRGVRRGSALDGRGPVRHGSK